MMSQVSEPVTKSTTLATSPNSESEPLQLPNTPRVLEKKDGKIHIGNEVWLREEVWNKIQATRKDSLYVKELAVAIWGSSELKQRSVSGKECPTKNTEAKPPLTPDRLGTLKDCFYRWLRAQDLEKAEVDRRSKLVGFFISQKIQDLNKKDKKNLEK
ncbi:BEN domain-containing protein 5-like [Melanotaenia boesemani]|uniref:BEN domain-containing protein 5-like n=1 Tax=Melanotaenia boesemani TaxID=1250792 RepID=UPI001C0441EB|nr:BEN domain-containing protein 5-like [Melanotaenia boesemani]XP_041833805.1 BEN domain-containing protein 5-like [Melanotaenia boesemani]XP_041835365.1 BEN domain-containing protein 5-like [Melanotaenia boesemani]